MCFIMKWMRQGGMGKGYKNNKTIIKVLNVMVCQNVINVIKIEQVEGNKDCESKQWVVILYMAFGASLTNHVVNVQILGEEQIRQMEHHC